MNKEFEQLYRRWVDLWNGDLSAADEIINESFVFHREHGQTEVRGVAELRTLVEQSRAAFTELNFVTQIGPLHNDEWVAGRNEATGVYKGGMPGATAPAGTNVTLTGIDMLRVQNGKIVECWHNGNDLAFMMQLGAVQFSKG